MEREDNILYQCEITFIRAENVPVADLRTLSCDPYLKATIQVQPQAGYSQSESISYRTHTMRNTRSPVFNSRWIVSGIPHKGFTLTFSLLDEDWKSCDDSLGKTDMLVPNPQEGLTFHEGWDSGEIECKVEKHRGSPLTYLYTYLASMAGKVSHHVRVWIRIKVIGKAENQADRRIYTVGPPRYSRHFSPLIGHIVSRGTARQEPSAKGKYNKQLAATTFVANRLQLKGPCPAALRLRYVGYVPLIKALFKKSGIRGKILHFALKRQFKTIYGYSKSTVYGVAGEHEINTDPSLKARESNAAARSLDVAGEKDLNKCSTAIARDFLRMTSHGTAGRIFTYIITLDSELRFTESGKEFSVNLLSKHSMHADAAKEVAFSGEFFVRRMVHDVDNDKHSSFSQENATDTSLTTSPSENPNEYELVIDNSSGTYRPHKDLLPVLQKWLSEEGNMSGLGKVTAIDVFDETLQKWKRERQEEKRHAKSLYHGQKQGKGKQKDMPQPDERPEGIVRMSIPSKFGRSSSGTIGLG